MTQPSLLHKEGLSPALTLCFNFQLAAFFFNPTSAFPAPTSYDFRLAELLPEKGLNYPDCTGSTSSIAGRGWRISLQHSSCTDNQTEGQRTPVMCPEPLSRAQAPNPHLSAPRHTTMPALKVGSAHQPPNPQPSLLFMSTWEY